RGGRRGAGPLAGAGDRELERERPASRTRIAAEARPAPLDAAASPAPSSPVAAQPAICQGVHGPCPKKKFEVRAASAPTAKPGAPPNPYPDITTMSVVG